MLQICLMHCDCLCLCLSPLVFVTTCLWQCGMLPLARWENEYFVHVVFDIDLCRKEKGPAVVTYTTIHT